MTRHPHPTIDRLSNSFLFMPSETSPPAIAEKGAIRTNTPCRPLVSSPFLSYVFVSPWLWLPQLSLLIVRRVSLGRKYKVSNLPHTPSSPHLLVSFQTAIIEHTLITFIIVVSLSTLNSSIISERYGLTCFDKTGSRIDCYLFWLYIYV